jgi:hypothetical protein
MRDYIDHNGKRLVPKNKIFKLEDISNIIPNEDRYSYAKKYNELWNSTEYHYNDDIIKKIPDKIKEDIDYIMENYYEK